MPGLAFSGANLAVVAYAEVNGDTGASPLTNSGITTTRIERGSYLAFLPANMSQAQARDIILVQPKGPYSATTPGASVFAKMAVVDDVDPATKAITVYLGYDPGGEQGTLIDSDFSLLILRTTISPPAGSPA